MGRERFSSLFVTILSFGFKYGIPSDADLVFDVRFLPNPYYDENLRSHTGNEKAVQDFVRRGGTADVFLDKLYPASSLKIQSSLSGRRFASGLSR